jgi:hypothetical protein
MDFWKSISGISAGMQEFRHLLGLYPAKCLKANIWFTDDEHGIRESLSAFVQQSEKHFFFLSDSPFTQKWTRPYTIQIARAFRTDGTPEDEPLNAGGARAGQDQNPGAVVVVLVA